MKQINKEAAIYIPSGTYYRNESGDYTQRNAATVTCQQSRDFLVSIAKESHVVDEMMYHRLEKYVDLLPSIVNKSKYRNKSEYFSVLRTPNQSKNFETLILKPRERQNKKSFFIVDDWEDFKIPDPELDACYRLYKSRTNLTKPLFSYPTFLRAS